MNDTDQAVVYARICEELLDRDDVTTGKMMSADALRVNGKSFACLLDIGRVLKLHRQRIDKLKADSMGRRLILGERVMKEWVISDANHAGEWAALTDEGRSFVRGG